MILNVLRVVYMMINNHKIDEMLKLKQKELFKLFYA